MSRPTAIVIRGLPGIGKTTLANAIRDVLLDQRFQVFHLNADVIRHSVNSDLKFGHQDRIENARRIGAMAYLASKNNMVPLVDFVMPTKFTFDAFHEGFCRSTDFHLYSILTPQGFESRFPDTQKMFEPIQDFWLNGLFPNVKAIPRPSEASITNLAEDIVQKYLWVSDGLVSETAV